MAEFLVLVHDAPGREVGDIVCAAPDGFAWGGMEHLDPGDGSSFLVVRIDLTTEDARNLAVPLTHGAFDANSEPYDEVVYPSRYRIDLNTFLDYDALARLYTVDWDVPVLPVAAVIDKAGE